MEPNSAPPPPPPPGPISSNTNSPLKIKSNAVKALDAPAGAAPPPPPPKIPSAAPKWKADTKSKEKSVFKYSTGDLNSLDWSAIEDFKVSDTGSAGVFFINFIGNGTVVLKGSSTVVQDYFATLLGEEAGFRVAKMRIVDWSHPSAEWEKMLNELGRFAHKRDAGGFEERKIKKEIGERCFLEIMEMVVGQSLTSLSGDRMKLLFGAQCDESFEFLKQLGEIVALDILLDNWDRIPVIWDNPGNWGNVIVTGGGNQIKVVGIDNGFFYVDSQHEKKLDMYLNRANKFILDACAAIQGQGSGFCDQMKSLIPSYADATGFTIPDCALPYIQHGILRGLVQIAENLTDAKLNSASDRVCNAINADWGHIWENGVKSVKSSFVSSVLAIIRSRGEILKQAAAAFDSWLDGSPFRILVMQSKPLTDIEFAAAELEKALADHPNVDFVLYPEGWNTTSSFSTDKKAHFEDNDLIKRFIPIAQKFNTYVLPGTTMERADGKLFKTAVIIDPSGAIAGTYRKQKPVAMEHITPGNENLFIELPKLRSKFAVLICFDIENADIRDKVLSELPVLLLNPVHIGDASSGGGQSSDLTWRNAVDSMRRKMEKISLDYDIDIIRCDMPKPFGAGSSQAIGPWRTTLCSSPDETSFLVELYPRGSRFRRFLGTDPPRPRTAPEDNTMNRILVRTVENNGGLLPIACCNVPAKVNPNQPTGDIAISFSDGSIRFWDRISYNFSAEKLQNILCPPGDRIWTKIRWNSGSRSISAQTAHGDSKTLTHERFNDSTIVDTVEDEPREMPDLSSLNAKYGSIKMYVPISSIIIALATQSGHIIFYDVSKRKVHSELRLSENAITTLEYASPRESLYLLAIDSEGRFFSLEFSQNNFAAQPSTVLHI